MFQRARISWNIIQGWNNWLTTFNKTLPVPSWASANRRHCWHSPLTLLALLALLGCVPWGTDISNLAMPTTLLQNGFTPKGLDSPTTASYPTTHGGELSHEFHPLRWFTLQVSSSSQKYICNCWGGAHIQLHWWPADPAACPRQHWDI